MTKKYANTLFIIGNGFDIWQGLPTKYEEFQRYYEANKFLICKELGIKPIVLTDKNSKKDFRVTPFDLIYIILNSAIGADGEAENENDFVALDCDYWNEIEKNLADLDDFTINGFFGKEDDDLDDMERDLKNTERLLKRCMYRWINTVEIEEKESGYNLSNSIIFNFNYTRTLEKRFHVEKKWDFHVHGVSDDKNSIVFGHSSHRNKPNELCNFLGGRFGGLYTIDKHLERMNKKTNYRIRVFNQWLKNRDCRLEEINNVYVLGHSLSTVDKDYFRYFAKNIKDAQWNFSYWRKERRNIERFVKKYNINNYTITKGIDETIKNFRIVE